MHIGFTEDRGSGDDAQPHGLRSTSRDRSAGPWRHTDPYRVAEQGSSSSAILAYTSTRSTSVTGGSSSASSLSSSAGHWRLLQTSFTTNVLHPNELHLRVQDKLSRRLLQRKFIIKFSRPLAALLRRHHHLSCWSLATLLRVRARSTPSGARASGAGSLGCERGWRPSAAPQTPSASDGASTALGKPEDSGTPRRRCAASRRSTSGGRWVRSSRRCGGAAST